MKVQALEQGHFSPDDVRQQLARILRSRVFFPSARISRFLRFAVEETISGRASQLKEYLLGVEVFDRPADYDPRTDPIVRVEARRLRAKLSRYYETEGVADILIIDLPTGGYVPRFSARHSAPGVPAPKFRGRTIAVLPFANLSAEPGSEYFSQGLTTELIHALTRVEDLQVAAWTSASQLGGRPHDLGEIRRRLNVELILDGAVRQASGMVRMTARLIDAATGVYLWSETYDRRLSGIFAIQEEIAEAIVGVLKVRLTGAHPPRAEPNLETYRLYLKGRFHWSARTEESLRTSVEWFQQAISRDAHYAPAYAGLADAWSLLGEFGYAQPAEVMPRAKSAALRALELDSTLAEAHTSLALIRSLYDWEWHESETHYRRALELNPGYAQAHHWYAVDFLVLLARFDEAVIEILHARRLDPLSPGVNESAGFVLTTSRRFEEAVEHYRAVIQQSPEYFRAHTSLGRALGFLGRYDEAIASLLRGRELSDDVPSIYGALGQIYALAGREAEARRELSRLHELASRRSVSATCFALIHTGLGEHQKALDWLELSLQRRELPLTSIGVHPAYDALRREPRFKVMIQRIGLPGD